MQWTASKDKSQRNLFSDEDSTNSKQFSSTAYNEQSDLFLELFSNDFVKITKSINLKRRVRGRDD